MATPSVTYDHSTWKLQQTHIERLMDHSALTSAHPEDTLVLAGPARLSVDAVPGSDFWSQLLPIGMLQSFNVMLQKPTQPMTAIGSARTFFVSGKSQGSANIARLFVNGRNMLRVLYTNAVQAGLNVHLFDDKAALTNNASYFMNLDSELFMIPFGLAVFFRDKVKNAIGSFYMELCALNSYNVAFNAGQNLILENVALLFDRALPMDMGSTGQVGELQESDLYTSTLIGSNATESTVYPDESSK